MDCKPSTIMATKPLTRIERNGRSYIEPFLNSVARDLIYSRLVHGRSDSSGDGQQLQKQHEQVCLVIQWTAICRNLTEIRKTR